MRKKSCGGDPEMCPGIKKKSCQIGSHQVLESEPQNYKIKAANLRSFNKPSLYAKLVSFMLKNSGLFFTF